MRELTRKEKAQAMRSGKMKMAKDCTLDKSMCPRCIHCQENKGGV